MIGISVPATFWLRKPVAKWTGIGGETLTYGEPGNWQRYGLLATNGLLHEAALAAYKGA
ncbi:MAG: hypothetical protein KatS3mg105_2639 [Gemmatales bacterium]|nr:MAG: hypothetical protein KatS3mg105_2639 [Gemmatales bacterium]